MVTIVLRKRLINLMGLLVVLISSRIRIVMGRLMKSYRLMIRLSGSVSTYRILALRLVGRLLVADMVISLILRLV